MLIFRCIYQERPINRLWKMTPFPKTDTFRRILTEANALSAALKLAEGKGDREGVLRLTGEALNSYQASDNPTLVVRAAMQSIAGRPVEAELKPGDTVEDQVFEAIGRAWIAWASDTRRAEALKALKKLPVPKGPHQDGGALHLMAMQPWAQAVCALLQDDLDEARRMFRRATELSSQCGTETNSAVQWTYAASYFGR